MGTNFQHPTGKVPETVMLVAMGPSKGDWIQDRIAMNPSLQYDELWTLNAGADWVANPDLVFYMDDLADQCKRFPGTYEKVKKVKCPIITTQVYPELEISAQQFAYPLGEILNHVGSANDYFVNSVPYIIVYAQYIGVKHLIMAGVDYDYPGLAHRENGRPCAEFWVGWTSAKGMMVQVTQNSTLLNAVSGRPFYGYLRQPIVHVTSVPPEEKAISEYENKPDGQDGKASMGKIQIGDTNERRV